MDGSYVGRFPEYWIGHEETFLFVLSADGEEFDLLRTLVDPTTGVESTASTYSEQAVMVAPLECQQDHSSADSTGSTCVCVAGFYRNSAFGDGWSCERCDGGFQPASGGTRCESCGFGTFSADGQKCESCIAGSMPNTASGATTCQTCSASSASQDGVQCLPCPTDEIADEARTHCVCPINTYNSSLRGGNQVRCLVQGLRGDDVKAATTCVSCGTLECVTCGLDGLAIRPEYAVADTAQPWLILKCPFERACVQDGKRRCKAGHTGLLCAVCEPGFGLDRDDCVQCSSTNSNPYTALLILGLVCAFVAAIYLNKWRRRRREFGDADAHEFGLIANPLQYWSSSPVNLRGSSSSSPGRVAAVAQKSTVLLRVVYQPIRIIVGYIQVVTQIGPVLDLEFPTYTRMVLTALKPFMIDLQSILQLDCLSDGLLNFYATWVVRVFVIPAVLLGFVGLQYCFERRRVGASTAAGVFKSNAFVVVFLCYPGVCNQAFAMFNCRKVGASLSVLVCDYSVQCSTEKHVTFQLIAGVYIAFVAFGIPLHMARRMWMRMCEYGGGSVSDKFVARRIADDFQIADDVAADAIRDCNTGREYSFLVNAFKPRYFFWEGTASTQPKRAFQFLLPVSHC